MGVDGIQFPMHKSGLMNLYSRDVRRDSRHIVAFGRDISLVSATDYGQLQPPSGISKFPTDLANPDLEYSGVYEDGWISESAFFVLSQPKKTQMLHVQGLVPQTNDPNFRTKIMVKVDGKILKSEILSVGYFELDVPISDHNRTRHVEFISSQSQTLSAPDTRKATFLLQKLSFR